MSAEIHVVQRLEAADVMYASFMQADKHDEHKRMNYETKMSPVQNCNTDFPFMILNPDTSITSLERKQQHSDLMSKMHELVSFRLHYD